MKKSVVVLLVCIVLVMGGLVYLTTNVGASGVYAPTMLPTNTKPHWSTPSPYLTPTVIPGSMPCTAAPSATATGYQRFPTINMPTHPPQASLTTTATAVYTFVPTLTGFAMGTTGVTQTGGGTASITCSLGNNNSVIQCSGSINAGTGGNGVGTAWMTFYNPKPPAKFYYAYQFITTWGVPVNWGLNRFYLSGGGYPSFTYDAPSGGHNYETNGSETTTYSGTQMITVNYSTSNCRSDESCTALFNYRFSDSPITTVPTPTSYPTPTIIPCYVAGGAGSTPVAVVSPLNFTDGGCLTILPGFTIPTFGLYGLPDLTVPEFGICIMYVTIAASFLGISIDTLLTALIVLGLGFALFNEFRV